MAASKAKLDHKSALSLPTKHLITNICTLISSYKCLNLLIQEICLENFWIWTGLKLYEHWFLNSCVKGVCAVAISCVCPIILDLCIVSTRAHIEGRTISHYHAPLGLFTVKRLCPNDLLHNDLILQGCSDNSNNKHH